MSTHFLIRSTRPTMREIRPRSSRRCCWAAAAVAAFLSGCAGEEAQLATARPLETTAPVGAAAVPVIQAGPADPLAIFAARSEVGQVETVSLPGSGRVVTARLVRTYHAASGRECRELQFGAQEAGPGASGAIYCNDPVRGWGEARALLRGGALYRP